MGKPFSPPLSLCMDAAADLLSILSFGNVIMYQKGCQLLFDGWIIKWVIVLAPYDRSTFLFFFLYNKKIPKIRAKFDKLNYKLMSVAWQPSSFVSKHFFRLHFFNK